MISKIWELNKQDFQSLVYECNSLADILRRLDLYVSNGNYRPLKARLLDENIDYSHITLGLGANKGKIFTTKRIPLSELLQEGSTITSSNLKRKLLQENVLEDKCSKCNIEPKWCGEKLVLQLDHINGNSRDNRLENLRILCPNCHSQTNTYAACNKKKRSTKPINYCECGKIIKSKSSQCKKCAAKNKKTKITWPNQNDLLEMVKQSNYTQVAKQLGVSDNAVRKKLNKSF